MLDQQNGTQTLSFDKYRYPIDPEQILPVQFTTGHTLSGPEKLCWACLQGAALSLDKLRDYAAQQGCEPLAVVTIPARGTLRDYQIDAEWILGTDEDDAYRSFSFEWVCDVLHMSATELRAAYVAYLHKPVAKPESKISACDRLMVAYLREHPEITIAEIGRGISESWQKTWETAQRLEARGTIGMKMSPHGRQRYYVKD